MSPPRPRRFAIFITMSILVALCVGYLVVSRRSTTSRRVVVGASSQQSSQTSETSPQTPQQTPQTHADSPLITSAVGIPANYDRPSALAPDSKLDGVWFWTSSATDARLFFWDAAAQKLESWVVGTDAADRRPFLDPSLAVTSTDVWIGFNQILARLDIKTGDVSRVTLPKTPVNPASDAFLPSEMKGLQAVRSLAVGPTGRVAVAIDNAAVLELYDPATQAFKQLALPTAHSATAVQFSSTGTLFAGMRDYGTGKATEVLITTQEGASKIVSVPDADTLSLDPNGTDMTVGALLPTALSGDGSASAVALPSAPANSSLTVTPNSTGIRTLADGRHLATVNVGIVTWRDGTGLSVVPFPHTKCPEFRYPINTPTLPRDKTLPGSALCVDRPAVLAIDPSGNIWVTTAGTEGDIAELPAGSY